MNPEQQARFDCLQLAAQTIGGNPEGVLRYAERWHDFVTGKKPKTPREQVNAALDRAGVK